MKKIGGTFLIALLAGAITLGSYKLFIEEPTQVVSTPVQTQTTPAYTPVNYEALAAAASGVDFTEAAERTVNGVVHVKNVQVYKQPRNMMEYLRGGGQTNKGIVGAGSGVIIYVSS